MTFRQIVEHGYLVAVAQQFFNDDAADVSRSTCDQNLHSKRCFPFRLN
jgi:hypothetical protein